jgi:transporter family-2 protein
MRWLISALIAVVGGTAVAVQAQFTGTLRQLGTLESVFVTYGLGGLVVGAAMAVARGGNLAAWRTVPWYAYTTGLLGLVIIASLTLSVSRLGLVPGLVLITVVQFAVGAVLQHFGLLGALARPIDAGRVIGLLLLLGGTWLVVR